MPQVNGSVFWLIDRRMVSQTHKRRTRFAFQYLLQALSDFSNLSWFFQSHRALMGPHQLLRLMVQFGPPTSEFHFVLLLAFYCALWTSYSVFRSKKYDCNVRVVSSTPADFSISTIFSNDSPHLRAAINSPNNCLTACFLRKRSSGDSL